MNNLKKIPKMLYLYWDGKTKLSFLQYLTIKSFYDLNKDWKIIVYLPEKRYDLITWNTDEQKTSYVGRNHFEELQEFGIEIIKIDFETIGFSNDVPEVIKSDYLRYYLLGKYGGCWMDFDVLSIKSFKDIAINDFVIYGEKEEIDTVIVYSGSYFPIGFLMSSENNPIFLNILENCKNYLNLNDYQSLGCKLIKNLYDNPYEMFNKHPNTNILELPLFTYLPFEWTNIQEIFDEDKESKIKENTFGIHWFNGSSKAKIYQNLLDENVYNKKGTIYKYIEKYIKNKFKVSIVMAYYNRKDQLLFTLQTINNSVHKDIEIIIVDDASNEDQQLDNIINNYDIEIKYIKIDKFKKTTTNPCVAYNIGLKEAKGDIIILQNPECCHIGDVIKYIIDNLQKNEYFSFTCANLHNKFLNLILQDKYKDNDSRHEILKFINSLPSQISNNILWYNHPIYRPVGFHFLSAIFKKDLDKLVGFDERYAYGSGYDDAELVERIKYNKINFKIIDCNEKPFVIHQWHEKSIILNNLELVEKNRLIFNEHMKELGINKFYLSI